MKPTEPRADGARLAVFAKAPRPGEVKTRLASLLGEHGAADLHASLVHRALEVASAAHPSALELWCAPDAHDPFFVECARRHGCVLHEQSGGDLGERMAHAFESSLAHGAALVLIGSDCPALEARHVLEAAAALRDHDAVFVPAEDGGYVLVGLARAAPSIFTRIAWGTPVVMRQTRERLAEAGLRWRELETLWDVDRPDDYRRLQQAGLLAGMHR
jgi:rSAM/selenodomain-associated transferase 1